MKTWNSKKIQWIRLDEEITTDGINFIRIGSSNDGSLLEVLVTPSSTNLKSSRQKTLDPLQWEESWHKLTEGEEFQFFSIASRHVNDDLEILHILGISRSGHFLYFIRNDSQSRFGTSSTPPNLPIGESLFSHPILHMNINNNLEVLWLNNLSQISHAKRMESSNSWGETKTIPGIERFNLFSSILNKEKCIEVYGYLLHSDPSRLMFTRQKNPDALDWDQFREIAIDPGLKFHTIFLGLNSKEQVVIFVEDRETRKL